MRSRRLIVADGSTLFGSQAERYERERREQEIARAGDGRRPSSGAARANQSAFPFNALTTIGYLDSDGSSARWRH